MRDRSADEFRPGALPGEPLEHVLRLASLIYICPAAVPLQNQGTIHLRPMGPVFDFGVYSQTPSTVTSSAGPSTRGPSPHIPAAADDLSESWDATTTPSPSIDFSSLDVIPKNLAGNLDGQTTERGGFETDLRFRSGNSESIIEHRTYDIDQSFWERKMQAKDDSHRQQLESLSRDHRVEYEALARLNEELASRLRELENKTRAAEEGQKALACSNQELAIHIKELESMNANAPDAPSRSFCPDDEASSTAALERRRMWFTEGREGSEFPVDTPKVAFPQAPSIFLPFSHRDPKRDNVRQ